MPKSTKKRYPSSTNEATSTESWRPAFDPQLAPEMAEGRSPTDDHELGRLPSTSVAQLAHETSSTEENHRVDGRAAPKRNSRNPGRPDPKSTDSVISAALEKLSPEQQQLVRAHCIARSLECVTGAAYVTALTSTLFSKPPGPEVGELYLKRIFKEAGDPKDPIERMMIEQLVLAHHKVGELYVRAESTKNPQEQAVYNAAAGDLLSGFRRTALALKRYRASVEGTPASIPKQQSRDESQGARRTVARRDCELAPDAQRRPANRT
jgi:hypothetical protein